MRAGLQLRLLGPFEARLDGEQAVSLGGLRQRALLAILALSPNEVVSTDRLVDQLWGEHPPATAVHTVQVFVSRLRGALGPAGERLVTRPPGYALEVDADTIDSDRCERLYSEARAALASGDPAEAAALLREAIALWRGAPLAEFTYEPFAQATIARLEELRTSCREELVEAHLALGQHAEVVSELEALVREQPFRERPRGQLMLALYRCGRQAEALEAFQKARRALVDELGVEPSDTLRTLEQAILQQDESLQAPSRSAITVASDAEEAGGASTDTESPPAAVTVSEPMQRKNATVLVARIEATGDADPERERALVRAACDEAGRVIARHGGTFVSALGGEVVAVFGVPVTKEDDALRALRAAEELRTSVTALSAGEIGGLVTRVGVDTGEVVTETAGDLFGAPLTRGIALARAARESDVVMSDATRRLASDAIRVEPGGDGTGWQLLGLTAGPSAHGLLRASPMVGREAELENARATFARTGSTREAHLLTVIGEAGIGKSRFAQELISQLADHAVVLRGHCLSYGDGTAFWPLREALAEQAGGESRQALRALIGDEEDAELVTDIVAAALGFGPAESYGEQVPWAFRRVLENLSRQRSLVLVIEDAHWAEPPLLDLVDYLVDWLTAPVLVVCLARSELLDLRPRWGGGHARVSSVVLVPLSEEESLRLLNQHLDGRHLSAAESARILKTAEGNPLFVEQLLAMSAEDPWWTHDSEIPATLQALLAARLDRLGPGERAFIERAAVIGRGFWPSAVVELLPAEARSSAAQHLRTLVHRGLVQPDRSTLAGQEELRFHHILIRDVAYRSTPKRLRAELHEGFADWLKAQVEGSEEFIGYHLEQAFLYRGELGRVDARVLALAARAGEALALAGRRALGRGDANAGVKLLRRSTHLFTEAGAARPDVLLDLGIGLSESGEFDDAERALEAAFEQALETNAEALSARASIELSVLRALVDPSARVEEMLAVAERAITVFTRLGDEGGLARAWKQVAEAHWARCHCAEMERVLERALEHAERAGAELERSRILSALAIATVFGPRSVNDGRRRCEAILERAHDDLHLIPLTETMLAVLEAMDGDFQRARDRWRRTRSRLEEVGLYVTAALLEMYPAFIELMAETPENLESEMAAAYSVVEQIGDQSRLATMAALVARLQYAQGHYDEAERYSVVSEEAASQDDVGSQILWRGARARVLARAGNAQAAEELAASAVALAEETDLLMLHGDALRDRAEVMALLAQPAEAMRHLEQGIVIYERKGMRASAEGARRFRASLAPLTEASSVS